MVRQTDRPAMTIAVDLGRKATKQTKKKQSYVPLNSITPLTSSAARHLRLVNVESCIGR